MMRLGPLGSLGLVALSACARPTDFDQRFARAASDLPAAVLHHEGSTAALGGNVRGARGSRDQVPNGRSDAASALSRVVRQNLPGVKACFEIAAQSGRTEGKAIVNLSIAADGRVSEVQVEAPDFRDSNLASCVGQQARRWTFPPGRNARAISYPFVFMAG